MNKVLIVDDEPWTRDLYALALKKSEIASEMSPRLLLAIPK